MKRDTRQFRSRKTRKQALHIDQHRAQKSEKENLTGTPISAGFASAIASALSLLGRRHQGR